MYYTFNNRLWYKDIGTIQLQRQVTRLYNQIHSEGILALITKIRCFQLQSEIIATRSPLSEWKIHSKDLKVKYNIIAKTLAIMFDHNMSINSSGTNENIIKGGGLPISDYFSHEEIFKNRFNMQLKKHGITFISQLIASGGDRLLNFRDLRTTLNINTKGRKPNWFKIIEQKCLINVISSRKLKVKFHIGKNYTYSRQFALLTTVKNVIGSPFTIVIALPLILEE